MTVTFFIPKRWLGHQKALKGSLFSRIARVCDFQSIKRDDVSSRIWANWWPKKDPEPEYPLILILNWASKQLF